MQYIKALRDTSKRRGWRTHDPTWDIAVLWPCAPALASESRAGKKQTRGDGDAKATDLAARDRGRDKSNENIVILPLGQGTMKSFCDVSGEIGERI
jgi:hypothetical protein